MSRVVRNDTRKALSGRSRDETDLIPCRAPPCTSRHNIPEKRTHVRCVHRRAHVSAPPPAWARGFLVSVVDVERSKRESFLVADAVSRCFGFCRVELALSS